MKRVFMDRLSLIESGAVDIEGTMARAMEGTGVGAPAHPQIPVGPPGRCRRAGRDRGRGWAFLGFQIAGVKGGDVGHSCAAIESAGRRR
jgi:hypothetical protein